MKLPKNILVPTDFSDHAEGALDYAVTLAAKLDAKVHLVHIVGVQTAGLELGVAITAGMIDELVANARTAIDRLVAARASKCSFGPSIIEVGDTRSLIPGAAAQTHADLIVMGTHGRRGIQRLLLGSVAEAVARVAPTPVLLVPRAVG